MSWRTALFAALPLANCKFVVAITSCQLYDNKGAAWQSAEERRGREGPCTVAERKQINWRQALIGNARAK